MITFKEYLTEAIKGWKNVHGDLMKARSNQGDFTLHQLTKDGRESGMHTARKNFSSEEAAKKYHDRIRRLNPNSNIRHNFYKDGKFEGIWSTGSVNAVVKESSH